jgi:hypothetical protein
MDDRTDTLTRPGFPPPPPSSVALAAPPAPSAVAVAPPPPPVPWPGQISQAGPALPIVTPAVPRPATTDTSPFTATMFGALAPEPAKKPSQRGGGLRRAVKWLVVLAILGGIAFAGVTYGPDLVERANGPDEDNGPTAPLVYPIPTATPANVRTATFTVSELDGFGGTQTYEVTADFESGITQVVIPRTDIPDLEILTLWDQTLVRRDDEPTWYSLPRGDFPVDFSLGRSRWVRTLDELVPPDLRQFTTIDEANESSIETAPARRLVVSVDPLRLIDAQVPATTADGSPAPAPPLPPGVSMQPNTIQAGDTTGSVTLSMEIWVDDTGLVRKSVMPPELGGETITVTSVSPDAFQPVFPTPESVQPLTAQVLFRLGL